MRHRARARKLGRTTSHRLAMLRNMVTSLLDHERIRTTDAKAKEVRRVAERMITLGKRGDLHARRRALRVIRRREVAAKVFDELADRYRDRPGGYTRVIKLGHRAGDAAPLSLVELLPGAAAKAAAGAKPAGKGAGKTAPKKGEPEKKAKKAKAPAAARGEKPAPARKAAGKKSPAKKGATRKADARKSGGRKTTRRKSDD